jgi:hypothetical protein
MTSKIIKIKKKCRKNQQKLEDKIIFKKEKKYE